MAFPPGLRVGATTVTISYADNIVLSLGDDDDIAIVLNSSTQNANTTLTLNSKVVLLGTPVTSATAADSLYIANITASGDIIVAANRGGNSEEYIFIDSSAGTLTLTAPLGNLTLTATSGDLILHNGQNFIGDSANGNLTVGLTINQGGNDDEIISLKSSDVSHAITGSNGTEADTFGYFKKREAGGGIMIAGYIETSPETPIGMTLRAASTDAASTTKTTGGYGLLQVNTGINSGGNLAAAGADQNLVSIDNFGTVRFIFDAEGSGHADVEWVAYADYDDIALINDIESELQLQESEAQTERRKALEATGIIGEDSWHFENGKPRAMVNMTRLTMLHHGALIQIGESLDQLTAENKALRALVEAK